MELLLVKGETRDRAAFFLVGPQPFDFPTTASARAYIYERSTARVDLQCHQRGELFEYVVRQLHHVVVAQ